MARNVSDCLFQAAIVSRMCQVPLLFTVSRGHSPPASLYTYGTRYICMQPRKSPSSLCLWHHRCSRAVVQLLCTYTTYTIYATVQQSIFIPPMAPLMQRCNSPFSLYIWHHQFSHAIIHLVYAYSAIHAAVQWSIFITHLAPSLQPCTTCFHTYILTNPMKRMRTVPQAQPLLAV